MRQCPNCGLEISDPRTTICPRCSYQLAQYPGQPSGGASGGAYGWPAPSPQSGMDPTTQPGDPGSGASGPYGPYGAPPSQPVPGQPGASGQQGWAPPPPGYGPPSQGYGPPSYSYPPYGQAAPPSAPLPPGQGYPPGYPPGYTPVPPRPAQPNRAPALIGALVAVLVLAVVAAGLYLAHGSGNSTPLAGGTGTPTATPTPGEVTTYSSSLLGTLADWPNSAHCSPGSDGYHVQAGYLCPAPINNFTDGRVTVQVKALSGVSGDSDLFGLAIRVSVDQVTNKTSYYFFAINANGEWAYANCSAASGTCKAIDGLTVSAALHKGVTVFNTLSVDARGTQFTLYANGTQIGQADDSTYANGQVAVTGAYTGTTVFRDITIAQPQQ